MIQRQQARLVAGKTEGNVVPCEWSLLLPTVFDYLTERQYANGDPRRTSTITLFNDGGVLKAVLKDQDAGLDCWVASDSFAGLWAALEAALNDPKHEWRTSRNQAGDKARRVVK